MNKLILLTGLLVTACAYAAITLETQFNVGDASHKETFVINPDEAVTFIYRDKIIVEVRAVDNDGQLLLDIITLKKDEMGNVEPLSQDKIKTEWGKEVCVQCPHAQEYSIVIKGSKEG